MGGGAGDAAAFEVGVSSSSQGDSSSWGAAARAASCNHQLLPEPLGAPGSLPVTALKCGRLSQQQSASQPASFVPDARYGDHHDII